MRLLVVKVSVLLKGDGACDLCTQERGGRSVSSCAHSALYFLLFPSHIFFSLSKSMKTQTSPALSVAVPHDPMDRSKSEFVKGANAWIPRRCGVENTPPYQISVEFWCLGYDDSQES